MIPFEPRFCGECATFPTSSISATEVQDRRWQVTSASRFYQTLETTCHVLLVLSGIGTVLYSVAMFLSLR